MKNNSMSQNIMQSHFDDEAANYPSNFKTSHTQFIKWKLIEDHISSGSRCLDIGAANGRHIIPMAQNLAVKGIALDLSPSMLAKARTNAESQNTDLEYVVGRGEELPLQDNSCDAAICYSAMLFMENDAQCLAEMARVVRPGGTIIIDIHGSFNLGIYYWQRYYRKHGINKLFSRSFRETQSMLSRTGLTIIENYPTGVWMQVGLIPFIGPLIHRLGTHKNLDISKPDLDARLSQLFPSLANRWFIVAKKN